MVIFIAIVILLLFGALAAGEANRQKRGVTSWFILGFIFTINAFIALKVSKAADDEGHEITLWSVLGLFFGVTAIFSFEAGLNAENKGHDFDCWTIIGFCFGLLAVFVSCFLKPFEKTRKVVKQPITPSVQLTTPNTKGTNGDWECRYCGATNGESKSFCSSCGKMRV